MWLFVQQEKRRIKFWFWLTRYKSIKGRKSGVENLLVMGIANTSSNNFSVWVICVHLYLTIWPYTSTCLQQRGYIYIYISNIFLVLSFKLCIDLSCSIGIGGRGMPTRDLMSNEVEWKCDYIILMLVKPLLANLSMSLFPRIFVCGWILDVYIVSGNTNMQQLWPREVC